MLYTLTMKETKEKMDSRKEIIQEIENSPEILEALEAMERMAATRTQELKKFYETYPIYYPV